MNALPPSYPLAWPSQFPRGARRITGQFKTSLAGALKNVEHSLRLFAGDSGKKVEAFVITSNVSLGEQKPSDPGVAVWFVWDGLQLCIPVDIYQKPEANLQAIHHVLEARRTELRHGGINLVRATFTGFLSLPAPQTKPPLEILGLPQSATAQQIKDRYRELSKEHHPDAGGSADVFAEISGAFRQLKREGLVS